MVIHRLSEVRDEHGELIRKMCCLCFDFVPVDELFVDNAGDRWDMCRTCGQLEKGTKWRRGDQRHAGWSTCPMCERHWLVTPTHDCMMPACGHYGYDYSADNPNRPCEPCGLKHAWTCRAQEGTG